MAVRLHGSIGSWLIPQGETLLGRGKDCGLRIDDPRLSRRHARLVLSGHDLAIEDLGSTNGLTVNGQRLQGRRPLAHGDVVVCGPSVLMVSIDQTIAHPRAPEGSQDPASRRPHGQLDDTDHLEPQPAHPASSATRPVDAAIAAAVQPDEADVAKSSLRPQDAPGSVTSPLQALRSDGRPASAGDRRRTTTGVDAAPFQQESTGALTALPLGSGPASATRRLLAGMADSLTSCGLAVLLASPVFAAGYGVALAKAGASIADGLPRLGMGRPAEGIDLALTLFAPGGWERAWELTVTLQRVGSDAFAWIFIGAAAGMLVGLLCLLLATVAATVLHGAPFWHRVFGLVLVEEPSGAFLGWFRSFARWSLALLLWPLAVGSIVAGRRSLHDVLAGSGVRRRR